MRHDLSFNALLQSHYRAMQRKLDAIADAERRTPSTASADRASATQSDPRGGRALGAARGPRPARPSTRPPLDADSDSTIDASTRDLLDRISRL